MKSMLLTALLPLIVGPLVFAIMQAVKRLSAAVDALPPLAKRSTVVGLSFLLTLVGSWANVDLHCDATGAVNCLDNLDTDAIKAIAGAGLAFLLHTIKVRGLK